MKELEYEMVSFRRAKYCEWVVALKTLGMNTEIATFEEHYWGGEAEAREMAKAMAERWNNGRNAGGSHE